jgi:hypothetical protein
MLERQRIRDGVWLGVATALLTTASFYYGAVWFVCLGVVLIGDMLMRRWPRRRWWATVGAAGAISLVLIGPIAYVYASFHSRVGFVRDPTGQSLRPLDFVTPAPGSVVHGDLFDWAIAQQPFAAIEHGFFLGFAVIALALVGTLLFGVDLWAARDDPDRAPRHRREIALLGLAGVTGLVLAIGTTALGVRLPLHFLREWVPGFDAIRAASRLAVPFSLAVSIMAAWGLNRLLRGRSTEVLVLTVALVTSVVLAELYVEPLRADVETKPPVIEALERRPPGAVVELPMRETFDAAFALMEGPRLLSSFGDWRPRFNGFSGSHPTGYMDYVPALNRFPDGDALEALAELDLRYVVLHGAESRSDETYAFDEIAMMVQGLPESVVVERSGDSWLIDLGEGSQGS